MITAMVTADTTGDVPLTLRTGWYEAPDPTPIHQHEVTEGPTTVGDDPLRIDTMSGRWV